MIVPLRAVEHAIVRLLAAERGTARLLAVEHVIVRQPAVERGTVQVPADVPAAGET